MPLIVEATQDSLNDIYNNDQYFSIYWYKKIYLRTMLFNEDLIETITLLAVAVAGLQIKSKIPHAQLWHFTVQQKCFSLFVTDGQTSIIQFLSYWYHSDIIYNLKRFLRRVNVTLLALTEAKAQRKRQENMMKCQVELWPIECRSEITRDEM